MRLIRRKILFFRRIGEAVIQKNISCILSHGSFNGVNLKINSIEYSAEKITLKMFLSILVPTRIVRQPKTFSTVHKILCFARSRQEWGKHSNL